MRKNIFLVMFGVALMAMPSQGFSDHGTIGGGPGSQGTVNMDAIFGGANSGGPVVQTNEGPDKTFDDWDPTNPNTPTGPAPSDSGTETRNREFDHGSTVSSGGGNALDRGNIDRLNADFDLETAGGTDPSGFAPGTIGGDRFIRDVGNNGPGQFGVDNPGDFAILDANSPEAQELCGDPLF